jgi:hypothetical protein
MSASENDDALSSTDSEVIAQLNDKSEISTKRSKPAHIVTILLQKWNVRKTQKLFKRSAHTFSYNFYLDHITFEARVLFGCVAAEYQTTMKSVGPVK